MLKLDIKSITKDDKVFKIKDGYVIVEDLEGNILDEGILCKNKTTGTICYYNPDKDETITIMSQDELDSLFYNKIESIEKEDSAYVINVGDERLEEKENESILPSYIKGWAKPGDYMEVPYLAKSDDYIEIPIEVPDVCIDYKGEKHYFYKFSKEK